MTGWAGAGDPRFFLRSGPYTLQQIAEAAAAEITAEPSLLFSGVAPLQAAGPGHVSFLDNRRYADALRATGAGAVIVHPAMAGRVPPGTAALVTPEPYLAWARVASLFHPLPPLRPGIHATALVDPAAAVDPSAGIGPFAVIEAGAQIGPRCRIGPGSVIGAGVVIGADGRIGAHVSLSHALLGARVTLFPGVRIGQDGFGFAQSSAGFVSVPQLGRVILGDDVEIGANSTVDRGSAADTVIGAGTRIDNLVQIGHNVRIGRACVIVAQVGISGSTVIEDFVMIGGQAGLTGHLHVGARARIAAKSGIMGDVPAGQEYAGAPAMPARKFFRMTATLRRLADEAQRKPGDVRPDEGTEDRG